LTQLLGSLVVHAGLVVGAVQATQGAAQMVQRSLVDTSAVYVRSIAPPAAQLPHAATAATQSAASAAPSFSSIAPPTDIPSGIPPVDLSAAFDPSRLTGGGTLPVGVIPAAGSGDGATPRDFTQEEVDIPVRYLGGGEPVFPAALKQAGVAGRVTLRFVVDARGQVEPASVRVIGQALPAFELAAREAILRARFEPAKVRGNAVRQLVEQRMVFEVGG
jgi:TonB family protein